MELMCALRVYMTADSLSGLIPSCLLTRSLTGRPDLSSMKVGIVIMLRERVGTQPNEIAELQFVNWMSSAACCSVGDLLSCRFCPDPWSLRPHAGGKYHTGSQVELRDGGGCNKGHLHGEEVPKAPAGEGLPWHCYEWQA